MFLKPFFSSPYQFKQICIVVNFKVSGAAFFVLYPFHGRHTVGINGYFGICFIKKSQGMNNSQKFADIIGSVFERSLPEYLLPGLHIHATVLHFSGITRAGSIHRYTVEVWLLCRRK